MGTVLPTLETFYVYKSAQELQEVIVQGSTESCVCGQHILDGHSLEQSFYGGYSIDQ